MRTKADPDDWIARPVRLLVVIVLVHSCHSIQLIQLEITLVDSMEQQGIAGREREMDG